TSAPSCAATADREPARLSVTQRRRPIPPTLGQARLLRHNRPLRDVAEELPQFPAPIPCVLPFSGRQCLYGQEFGRHRFLRQPYRRCETSHRGRQRGWLRACPSIPQTHSDRALLSLLSFQERPVSRLLRPAEPRRSAAACRRFPVCGRRVTGSIAPCQSRSYRSAPAKYGCCFFPVSERCSRAVGGSRIPSGAFWRAGCPALGDAREKLPPGGLGVSRRWSPPP